MTSTAAPSTGRSHEPLVPLSTRVPRQLRRRVRAVCVEQGRMMQNFIAEALREYLATRAPRR